MTNIHFEEQSRNLTVTIGDRGADDALVYNITPVNIKAGKHLLDVTIGMGLGIATDAEVLDAYRTALGEENFTRALGPIVDGDITGDGELRPAEYELLVNGALFWQAHGGGIDLAQQLQAGEPLPKVAEAYLAKVGMTPEKLATLRASIASNTESSEQTEPSGTASPSGSKTN
ncbi:hypothetical protein F8O06_02720 [Pseudoclavibacter sp. CFCC 14310]|uniref:hypothetical protein n=1 Tax=Pseudoclavibacter sp. CFCC 14310 TaxID=2615180 RepID=UPI001301635E|nr:hypothetical protein [Pseudoclavibacter sp. CFCC 14310]KAB1647470.1 hypothetical protein F8O06_02720 [Pseudoclavibacter sp. CFCC 14310]